jgi:Domain of unknown function (DUF4124)
MRTLRGEDQQLLLLIAPYPRHRTMRTILFSVSSLALAGLLLVASLPAVAQYKWRDSGGVIMYSDRPPPVGSGTVTMIKSPASTVGPGAAVAPQQVAVAATGTAPLTNKPADKQLADKMAEKAALDKTKETQEAAQKAKEIARQCDMLKATLRAYDAGERIAKVNDKGEREFLSDADRGTRSAEIRKDLSGNCK